MQWRDRRWKYIRRTSSRFVPTYAPHDFQLGVTLEATAIIMCEHIGRCRCLCHHSDETMCSGTERMLPAFGNICFFLEAPTPKTLLHEVAFIRFLFEKPMVPVKATNLDPTLTYCTFVKLCRLWKMIETLFLKQCTSDLCLRPWDSALEELLFAPSPESQW